MRRNHNKYKAMVMEKTSRDPVFKCEGTSIPSGRGGRVSRCYS